MSEVAMEQSLPAAPQGARVAVFGGSFNPPHMGHSQIALAVLTLTDVDAVWVLPCPDHPLGKHLAPLPVRMAMCERAFRHLASVFVTDLERHLDTPSFTVQTLRAIKRARPDLRLSLVIGTDILDELHRWREPDALPSLARLIVVPRPGPREAEGTLDCGRFDLASHDIRAALRAGRAPVGLDREVAAYIAKCHLYGPPAPG